jgi:hypothetical protein
MKSKKTLMTVKTPSGSLRGYEVGTTMYYVSQAPKGFWTLNISTPIALKVVSKHRAFTTAIKKAKSMAKKLL